MDLVIPVSCLKTINFAIVVSYMGEEVGRNMRNYVIKCPNENCERYVEVSKGFLGLFKTRQITCTCGQTINVKADKLAARDCPHCGNKVLLDQSKGERAICPVCHEKLNTIENMANLVEFSCPECGCPLSADKNAANMTCPLCGSTVDIQKQIAKKKVREKGIASVIKYEGENDTFVWKHPIEDFNMGSQLIVHESQEAIFFRDGRALDLFGAGRYTLTTQNLPILEKTYQLPTNPDGVFHSEVYFINTATQMGIKWGTDSKVRLFDPASGLHIELGACGNFNIKVTNSRKLLLKVVGTAESLKQSEIWDSNQNLSGIGKFKALIMNRVKANLARVIKERNINILEVDEHIDGLSDHLKDVINESLDEYGLNMPEFYITTIQTPDDNPDFQRLKSLFAEKTLGVRSEEAKQAQALAAQARILVEAQTKAQEELVRAQAEAEAHKIRAYAEAEEMRVKGYTYQQETARQVGLEAMKNGLAGAEGGGIGDIAGLGITIGAMSGIIGMTQEVLNPVMHAESGKQGETQEVYGKKEESWDCSCGRKGNTSKFCPECGNKKPERLKEGWDCICGKKGNTDKFCPECGARRPENKRKEWNCSCGKKAIIGKFCPECGKKREEAEDEKEK